MFKLCVQVAVLWLGLSVSAFAQERASQERLDLAREVLMLSGGESAFTAMMDQLRPMILQDLQQQGVSEQTARRMVDLMIEEFATEAPRFVELGTIAYAEAFTEEELRAIADFLRTPAGRAMVENQHEIAGAMMQAGRIIGADVAERVIARSRQVTPPHSP